MATVSEVGENVWLALSKQEANMLLALLGRTADGTFGDLYDDLHDAVGPSDYFINTYNDADVGTLYVRDLL